MKKIISLALILLTFTLTLAGCGGKDIYFDGKYDSAKYALNTDLDGARFLVPVEYNNVKQSQEEINNELKKIESKDEQLKFIQTRVTYVTDGTDYQIIKPGEFYLYVLNLKGLKNIDQLTDLSTLSQALGVDKFISFKDSNVEKYKCEKKNDYARATFSAIITDLQFKTDYQGYVSIIEDSDKGTVYAIVVGFGDTKHNSTAKEIATNLYLAETK